jgi:hypothetical protein
LSCVCSGIVFLGLCIVNFLLYNEDKDGMRFIGGLVSGILALLKIDDYLEYKKRKVQNYK